MAFELYKGGFPAVAASAINFGQAVGLDVGDVQKQVVPIASSNIEPFGVAYASAVNPGDNVMVVDDPGEVIKVTAAASLGHNANVGVVGATSSLGPVAAGASGAVVHRVGRALTAAAAGEIFSLYVSPKQLSGLLP